MLLPAERPTETSGSSDAFMYRRTVRYPGLGCGNAPSKRAAAGRWGPLLRVSRRVGALLPCRAHERRLWPPSLGAVCPCCTVR